LLAEQDSDTTAKELVDIHGRFVTWFLWGFCQMMAPIAGTLLTCIGFALSPMLGQIIGGLTGCATACGGLAWWITGIVWRFRSDGSYSCGDIVQDGHTEEEWMVEVTKTGTLFQHKSGKFMAIYYLICWSLIAFNMLCSIGAALYMCLCSKKE